MELDTTASPAVFSLLPTDNQRLARMCGQFNLHLKQVESQLGVRISHRGSLFSISGEQRRVRGARKVLQQLYRDSESDKPLPPEHVQMVLADAARRHDTAAAGDDGEDGGNEAPALSIKTRKGLVSGKTPRQRHYLERIASHDLSFGIGPAGTGKTYLAVASAAGALLNGNCERILLARPVVEAGERLGFLPGDIGQKVDPYLRPLYDALYEMLGFEKVARLLDRNVIEIAPLAYMRGRTLNNAFVILDEAQNTTMEQMKMFLTRIGFGSRAVITGDITQVDLPAGVRCGLRHAAGILDGIDGVSFTFFESRDVVRHPLVRRIVEAYERNHRQQERNQR